jgi:hypothetical protein
MNRNMMMIKNKKNRVAMQLTGGLSTCLLLKEYSPPAYLVFSVGVARVGCSRKTVYNKTSIFKTVSGNSAQNT